jgi:GNAT superfamily N-acetyltransferase
MRQAVQEAFPMPDPSERKLVLAFAREWDLGQTMVFEAVYHENLRLSLEAKRELLARCGCVWLYDAGTQELIGETYGFSVRENLAFLEGSEADDVYPFREQPAVYVLSTTILPAFQGRGFGKVLKAFFLGIVSQAGYPLVLGHAWEGWSVELNLAFGAAIHKAHPDWGGSGETYYFYTLCLNDARAGHPGSRGSAVRCHLGPVPHDAGGGEPPFAEAVGAPQGTGGHPRRGGLASPQTCAG